MALTSRQVFAGLKETPPETLTDIQRAARFYYLQHCFSGKIEGQTFGTATTAPPGLNLMRLEESLSAAHLRLASAYISICLAGLRQALRPRAYAVLPGPALLGGAAGYGVGFGLPEYEALADAMRTMRGKALLSINDHPKMREAFAEFPVYVLSIRHIVSGGAGVPRREMLVQSWQAA